MAIKKSLVNNVDKYRLRNFLASKLENDCEYHGMDLDIQISNMIEAKQISLNELNKYLFDELFFGMHRNINVYKIKGFRMAKYASDWEEKLLKEYEVDSLDYNKIIETYAVGEEEKISAVKIEYDELNNKVKNVKIIFIKEIKVISDESLATAYSYIPVEFDFDRRIIVVKGRSRKKIANDVDKCKNLMDKIFTKVITIMDIEISPFENSHETLLYNMSKNLLDELLSNIKAFTSINKIEGATKEYIGNIVEILPLENIELGHINRNIMDIEKEFKNIIEELILSDYFFNRDADNILDMGISAMLTEIRFNDNKNVTVRLAGENRRHSIFDSKSFLGLRNSLESVKAVEALSIAYKNEKKKVHVKYYADDRRCLRILFKDSKAYREEDFYKTWERFLDSESIITSKDERLCKTSIG